MKKVRILIEFLVPLVAVMIFGSLTLVGALDRLDLGLRDRIMGLVPAPPEDPSIVLVDIDDAAILKVGTWPWSRDNHAKTLLRLRELGADSLTFDIEFLDRGLRGTNDKDRQTLEEYKASEMLSVLEAVEAGYFPFADAKDAALVLLSESMEVAARDNDEYLGKIMKLFGNAFGTLNTEAPIGENPDAAAAQTYGLNYFSLKDVRGDLNLIPTYDTVRPAIVAISSGARGAGFTNIDADSEDGVFRRVFLLRRVGTEVFAQLAFAPLLSRLGNPPIEVQPGKIIVKTSELSENARPDIVIPLDDNGYMQINWPRTKYAESFTHVSVSELINLQEIEDDVETIVKVVAQNGLLTPFYGRDFSGLLDRARLDLEGLIRNDIDQLGPADLDAYYAQRSEFFEHVETFIGNGVGERILEYLDTALADPALPDEQREIIAQARLSSVENFTNLRQHMQSWTELKTGLEKRLAGAFCVIGWIGSSTTDIGVTPFDSQYMNPGTHASVANTIVAERFTTDWPRWLSTLIGAVIAFGVAVLVWRLKTIAAVISGFLVFVGMVVLGIVVFVLTDSYPGIVMPGLSVFVTVLGLTVYKFLGTEAEKRYIRGAFSAYLSPEVISELEADPKKLQLGGEKRLMTAMFTDVKGFSTFSEKLDPNDLVKLLNEYLTDMSDIILDTKGTIDKYEGDAIIAFWGAPMAQPDHARRAVLSAIQMRRTETVLNERLVSAGIAPSPLYTRMGINTGDMTVGNMGTPRRMNYTIMGNSVNLAARLEGVNKQYGTWILTSESTQSLLGDGFLLRKLDRVRVVGITTPVRLFEVVEEIDRTSEAMKEAVRTFEEGIDYFEQRAWQKALRSFEETMALNPDDGPSKTFSERAKGFQKNPPPENWDGVFSLNTK